LTDLTKRPQNQDNTITTTDVGTRSNATFRNFTERNLGETKMR